MKATRAITLVELVVTISLTLILAAVSVGGLVGVQTWRAASAVRRVHADLSYARARAMLSSCRTLCTIDTGSQSYELRQEAQPGTGKIDGQLLTHPLREADWRVSLADLGGGLTMDKVQGLKGGALGFGAEGLPLQASGQVITKDVHIRFSTGARIVVHGGSGFCELCWP